MFITSTIKDTIALQPNTFSQPTDQALITVLNKKYANRVLHDVGLCVCVFDLLEVSDGRVRYGDGCFWHKVLFRLVVFRPFASEVIFGKVKSSSEDGIRVTLGFFDDIHIPRIYLPTPCAFDPSERSYFWLPDGEGLTPSEMLDSPLTQRMYIDQGEAMRLRVEADNFYDDEPGPPKAAEGVQIAQVPKRSPYTITCSIAEQGLGPLAWWQGAAEEEMPEA